MKTGERGRERNEGERNFTPKAREAGGKGVLKIFPLVIKILSFLSSFLRGSGFKLRLDIFCFFPSCKNFYDLEKGGIKNLLAEGRQVKCVYIKIKKGRNIRKTSFAWHV